MLRRFIAALCVAVTAVGLSVVGIGSAGIAAAATLPTVTAISPATGPSIGGTVVTVTGTGFTKVTAVKFGSVAGTAITVDSSTKLTVTSPAHAGAIEDVKVTAATGTSAASTNDRFTFIAPPTVTGISPTSGPISGATTVTVTGTGFAKGDSVIFGGYAGTSVSVTSSTKLTVKSPATPVVGRADVTVVGVYATSVTSVQDIFTYFDKTPPGPVTALTVTTTPSSVTLAWTNPSAPDFTGVLIRRAAGAIAPASPTAGALVTNTTATYFTDTGLSAKTQYSYAIFAHDWVPNYAKAATVTVTTAAASSVKVPAIQGTVTAAGSLNLVAGVVVNAFTVGGNAGDAPAATAITNAAGTYTLAGPGLFAGAAYDVCFDPSQAVGAPATGYIASCYGGTGFGARITPGPTTPVTGIDTQLVAGSGITGTVTAAAGGAGLAGVVVRLFSVATGALLPLALPGEPDVQGSDDSPKSAVTDANGTYTLLGLPASSSGYAMCFDAARATGGSSTTGYEDQCYHYVGWTGGSTLPSGVVPLTFNTTPYLFDGADQALPAGAAISGTVAAASGGAGLAGVKVFVYPAAGGHLDTSTPAATTSASGTYSLLGLSPVAGGYAVCFRASAATGGSSTTGYLSQCYSGVAWGGSSSPGAVTPVTLGTPTAGAATVALVSAGAIGGTVTAAAGGAGLAGVSVQVFDSTGDSVASATTNAAGKYLVAGLGASASGYTVCFDASAATGGTSTTGYVDQCYAGVAWGGTGTGVPSGVTAVPVTLGAVSTASVALAVGGAILGQVTAAAGGGGLRNVDVQVLNTSTGLQVGSAFTATSGAYTVRGLPAGSYVVCFSASEATGGASSTGYLSQCYQNVAWDGFSLAPAGVTLQPVTTGATTSGINATLAFGGAISGQVTAPDGSALAGVQVEVFGAGQQQLAAVTTSADGTYGVTELPPSSGGYVVCFDGSSATGGPSVDGYLDQCYKDWSWSGGFAPIPAKADAVPVVAGATTSGINEALYPAGSFGGTVTAATGGAPVPGVSVILLNSSGTQLAQTTTAADGTYSLRGLSPGQYALCFNPAGADLSSPSLSPGGYLAQCYGGFAWDGYSIPPGLTLLGAGFQPFGYNVSLVPAAGISGRVTDAATGAGLQWASVVAFNASGQAIGTGFTAADGTYTLTGLPPTASGYRVCWDAHSATGGSSTVGYHDQCYLGVAWTGPGVMVPFAATSVPAVAGTVSAGVNAALSSLAPPVMGAISGTVTAAASGAGLAGVNVVVFQYPVAAGTIATSVGTTKTGANGTYTISVPVSAGGYAVCFEQPLGLSPGYLDQCYAGVAWAGFYAVPAGIRTVPVAASSTTTGVNAALATAGGISGVVTAGGAAIASLQVTIFDSTGNFVTDAYTASNGSYSAPGLAPSAAGYVVCFSRMGYVSQCYKDVAWTGGYTGPPLAAATKVAVTAGVVVPGINAALVAD